MVIDKPFAYHQPGPQAKVSIDALREVFTLASRRVEAECPATRERAIAITHLETAAMWAIKAVVFNDPASVPDIQGEAARR